MMDEAAEEALHELVQLQGLDKAQMLLLATWWRKWYTQAGHKRLGRQIMKFTELGK
jgi:aryl carrier-like protein